MPSSASNHRYGSASSHPDVTASTEARYSRAISSYFSSQQQQQQGTTGQKPSRTKSRYRAASASNTQQDAADARSMDSNEAYEPSSMSRQSSASSGLGSATGTKRRSSSRLGQQPSVSATTSRVRKRSSSRHRDASSAGSSEASNSSRSGSNRLLSSHQFSQQQHSSQSSSSSVYTQPETPFDLLRQPLLVLDQNLKIEKFNEDKGDLEAKTRTPSVKQMTKRDPARLQSHQPSRSGRGSSAATHRKQQQQHTTERPRSDTSSRGSHDDHFANTGEYQPRVPSRKAQTKRNTSRVGSTKRNTSASRRQHDDTHSARSQYSSQDEYADGYSIGSHGSNEEGNYTEFSKPKRSAPSAARRRASARKRSSEKSQKRRAPSAKKDSGYSASRYGDASSQPSAYPDNVADPFGQGGLPEEAQYEEVERAPCSVCGRKFAVDRLPKHEAACQKSAAKKRKKFDPKKQRLDAEARQAMVQAKRQDPPSKRKEMPANKMPKWKRDHLHFQQVLRAGRPQKKESGGGYGGGGGGGRYSSTPAYEEEVIDDRVPCPHCGRKFNADVADRHIPRCKNIINKPKTIRRGQGNAGGVSAFSSRTAAAARNGGSTLRRTPLSGTTARRTSRIRR